ncbi:MAG: 50S ribosomal protein L1 [Desulfobacteraceae bacterium]|nr:50S ribosomal protein L1 [Desulfobacteraceae bacterium]
MATRGKNYKGKTAGIDFGKTFLLDEALDLALKCTYAKFDESMDIAVRLGVDPRHADQNVRTSVVLPNGTGKTERVLVFAQGPKIQEALDAGADYAGGDDYVEKIKGGWLEFERTIATPDMMATVGKIGRVLGPRGLMPNAKLGTVTFDVARMVQQIKSGKVDFKVDKAGVVHSLVGKASFGSTKLRENILAFMDKIMAVKPSTSKGIYLKGVYISTTMGPGFKLDPAELSTLIKKAA